MAAATINGKPSLFFTPETPTEQFPIYAERAAEFTAIAATMAAEAELTARAKAEAEKHTLCPNCQTEMVEWRLTNPNATKLDAEDAHAKIWSECPSCIAEYSEWCKEADRAAELETAEHEAYEAHLEAQAEEHELASLGDSVMCAFNGHDLKWQAGVA